MKKRRISSIALFLALVLLMQAAIPIGASVSKAASSPKLNRSSITLEGVGDSYSLLVNNKVSGSYYRWYSSNKKIVAVNSYGMVKAISGGIATVKCKITYPTGRTKTLQCIVTVRVPATSLTISNAKMSANNTHTIKLGDSYNFNTSISPKGSTDNVYWKVEDTSIATVDNYGIVTAKKQGLTRLVATAANAKSKESSSIINDAINLYVAGQTAEVLSVTHVNATVVQISFSEAVNKDTIFHVDGSGKLLDNISFLAMRDEYGKMANGYGAIKGELSSDGTLLTLRSEFPFKGVYQLSVKSLSTVSNKVVETYVEKIDFNDKTAPTYVDTSLDETGLVATVNFSEPIDTTSLSIESVTRADGIAMNALSLAILRNKAIYTLSEDKMSLVVNMTNLNTNDKNKLIYVLMKGIKDISGNDIGLGSVTVQLTSDTTAKPQANVVSIVRTSYYNVAVTFDRTIMNPGTLYIQGYSAAGIVDSKNKKVVNYTIPAAAAILTGTQNVTI
ncbi:MAG TPA: Ig-like domain-containing protein, partial [Lachnospiraceae bacterium]|nr:Ig-like domain-containing protein [Lachnospiraceae bacterium]